MAKKKKMDKLSQEVAQALACGMSYGKWKAKQQPVQIVKKEIPDGYKECPHCGKVFVPSDVRQIYCDPTCSVKRYMEKNRERLKAANRERARERRARLKEGATNE